MNVEAKIDGHFADIVDLYQQLKHRGHNILWLFREEIEVLLGQAISDDTFLGVVDRLANDATLTTNKVQ